MTRKLSPTDQAPDFSLPAVDGSTVRLKDLLQSAPATVVLFLCNHCPYVIRYIPRLIDLQAEFSTAPQHVRFVGICSNDAVTYPDDSFDNMKIIAEKWGLNFPYLRDEDQSVARAYGAERTPEVFVLTPDGICQYEGGIDDSDTDASKVTQRPLRDALIALTQGKPVNQSHAHAIGCTIKWKKP